MTEYFGFDIEEREQGDWSGYLSDIDPKYHKAITRAMSGLCNWYGDKAHRRLDDWFTILYGMLLELEDVLECEREHIPFENFDLSQLIEVKDD